MHRLGNLEQRLLNDFQHDFPCVPSPYKQIADQLYVSEESILKSYSALMAQGAISRIGPVFAPGAVGVSTLGALAVPPEKLESIANWISSLPETNHNYEREDRFNLWFVVTSATATQLDALLSEISRKTELPLLILPLIEQFHIDLGFDMMRQRAKSLGSNNISKTLRNAPIEDLSDEQCRIIHKLQRGIPITCRPFANLWPENPSKERETIEQVLSWKRSGIIKRFGVVVRHHELGYDSNAMVVWDVPDDQVSEFGSLAAQMPEVTLCYKRPRQLPEWPYNLFCMIHGKCREEVLDRIKVLSDTTNLCNFPSKTLFSKQRFKQRGAHYVFNR